MRRSLVLVALSSLVLPSLVSSPHAATATRPPWATPGARLSSAYERMLRDQIRAGRVLPESELRRFGLDQFEADPTLPAPVAPPDLDLATGTAVQLSPDVLVNDRSLDASCTTVPGCAGRPLGQAETTIASLGQNVLAGWNDTKGFCPPYGAVQGYGYSTDGGATWTDVGDVPALPGGGRWRGDPVAIVDRKTGDFYIGGLYEGGAAGSGLAILRGHFAGAAFVVDLNQQIAVGGPNFIDKPWYAVDSLTGNVYVSYTNFLTSGLNQIEFIRSTDRGLTWSAPQVLDEEAAHGYVQGSRPVTGPDGELYVVWAESGFPLSRMTVRRSDDFGATFKPTVHAVDFVSNFLSGAPGFRRGFAPNLPSAAVDVSDGPHRGRLHLAWDESVNFFDATFPPVPAFANEIETNDFFASATPFEVGHTLRGEIGSLADVDLYEFEGLQGQTLLFACDSASTNTSLNLRLVCRADTAGVSSYRFLAFNVAQFPAVTFTLPSDGTYYLRLSTAVTTIGRYRIQTTWDTPTPGERGRDHRDQFTAWSDDGVAWSAPERINDSPPWFDGIFPELTVDGNGDVHAYWHDFRDDATCGALSGEFIASSGDGGATWGANRLLSDALSFWSFNACGSANQGDYQGVTSEGSTVRPCWADARLGDPDVFTEATTFAHHAWCPPPISAGGGATVTVSFRLGNDGNTEGRYAWSVSDDFGWVSSVTPAREGETTLGAGSNGLLQVTVRMSGDCHPGVVDTIRLVVDDTWIPGRRRTCSTAVTCTPTTDVGEPRHALALAPPRPNPTTGETQLAFTLARAGRARLALYDAAGARVRLLADGEREAGPHLVGWDGRRDGGRRAAPGLYFARLEADGRTLVRAISLVK